MSYVLHRSNLADYPVAVEGDGVYIKDNEGKKYIDGCCGAAVSCLGHNNQEVREAMISQINKLAYAHSGFFTTEPMEELAEFLVKRAPGNLSKTYIVSGGSEAVESAIKIARQYFTEIGQHDRKYVIARWQSYHGNTLGALSAGGNKLRREQFSPLLIETEHISPCYEYRVKEDKESSFDFGQRVANELEEKILELGPEKVMGFFAEPIVGATMGCVPPVEGYFKRIKEICDKYDILLILDEVMCGMGRTGSLFACEQEKIVPDIVTLAKGLGGGYQPIGAMMISDKIDEAITNGSGLFQHGHTYLGHAVACAASLKVQQIIERDNLLQNVKIMGDKFFEALKSEFSDHPNVGDIRGRGLFIGVEMVQDRESKKPFDPSESINKKIKSKAMQEGLMCYPMGGTIDGKNGDHVMFAPPFIVDESHVEEIIGKFSNVIKTIF